MAVTYGDTDLPRRLDLDLDLDLLLSLLFSGDLLGLSRDFSLWLWTRSM